MATILSLSLLLWCCWPLPTCYFLWHGKRLYNSAKWWMFQLSDCQVGFTCARFESLTGERHFMVLLSVAGQITECCLERGNSQFLPHSFQFIIHSIFPFMPVELTVTQVLLRILRVKSAGVWQFFRACDMNVSTVWRESSVIPKNKKFLCHHMICVQDWHDWSQSLPVFVRVISVPTCVYYSIFTCF
jgi:hypothetical protein